jgi:hypothetical protein
MADAQRNLDKIIAVVDERIGKLKPHVAAADEGAPIQDRESKILKCPVCAVDMQPGRVSVHGTVWGALVVGFSHQHLWFEPAGGADEAEIIGSGMEKTGWRRQACGFVGIRGDAARSAWRAGLHDL